ncbi:MAG: hypothetical protein JWP03_1182 [Phycisphaerales bacterium]|nr:hypothetical protein [Phycisphaerales bacterium]
MQGEETRFGGEHLSRRVERSGGPGVVLPRIDRPAKMPRTGFTDLIESNTKAES